MNGLQVFKFEDKKVRVIIRDGEPWFVTKDVAEILGYEGKDGHRFDHVPDEWKWVGLIPTRDGKMLYLSEPGLYFFVNRSNKPKALPFQKWIAGEVIPSIRKTGTYTVPGREEKPLKDPSAAHTKEIRIAYKDGVITLNEYRWKAFYLPPFEIDVPLNVTKRYPLTESESKAVMAEEVHIARRKRKLNPLVSGFAENFWDITGLEDDFVAVEDVYAKFKEAVGSHRNS